jgi:hypothetical protein
MKPAALFVDLKGPYPALGLDCWDETRDARLYDGPGPVIAHPPCARWSKLAKSVYARTQKEEHRPGEDGGCFASALASVRRCGGVLEHPACSAAWAHFGLIPPRGRTWLQAAPREWVCEVWQSDYGHLADKATWLLYVGDQTPFEFRQTRTPGTFVVSFNRKRGPRPPNLRPKMKGGLTHLTPPLFAAELVRLAAMSVLGPEDQAAVLAQLGLAAPTG